MIRVGIVGGTGYTGVELLRLLLGHSQVRLEAITSRAEAGRLVADIYPNLRGYTDLRFSDPAETGLAGCDAVLYATPNGISMAAARELLAAGVRIVDLAADFRLRDPAIWERWYGMPHACPELLEEAVYGLPELNREHIRSARIVANPGCYPTAALLGLIPLLERRLVAPESIIADCKSGASGAGRKAAVGFLLCEASESVKAYGVSGHRHLPEIRQSLEEVAGGPVGITFVPHLTPMIRGIHATLYARLEDATIDLQAVYASRYGGEPFVDVLEPGSYPETRNVRGANLCHVAVHRPQDGDTVVVLSVIDNLVKGAAGQAIQNLNLMFGLDETLGLGGIALLP